MTRYLLDTNALSILAPAAREPDQRSKAFQQWALDRHENLFLSAVTLTEVQSGISRLHRKRAHKRAQVLEDWLDSVIQIYDARIYALTTEIALETGRLVDRAAGAGADPGFEDAAIAATAATEGMTVVTSNTRHFKHFGVPFITPPD
ncbi:toxin FitB [Variibacter gotjawalensis]|uniref:Ribonuclease VapC n=1 Tax=Variibacter gotjawalensis TaxID=1333996 RepID=A0A0S3PWL1_9BRAD|nr:PIN domain-containing protein [Variibacter gotjawalensis]NIK46139.1 hypothetical protein [Variibacter gotjawalensis]RZS48057.1 hypothetical protein EV661_0452 [Variibacter gotjawalensis]BAT60313.1 toxin FitB [Variibacter gotjawalensis]